MNDCYDRILGLYHEKIEDNHYEITDDIWTFNSNYLRKLVDKLNENMNNYEKVKNCLLLLINLCFGVEEADYYGKQGKSSKHLSVSEKENYRSLLKEEILLN